MSLLIVHIITIVNNLCRNPDNMKQYYLWISNPRYIICAIILCFLYSVLPLKGQVNFPDDFLGEWSGNLDIYSGNRLIKKVNMSLFIDSTVTDHTYIYNLVYQGANEEPDTRNYLLVVVDRELGKFKIDEQNSVELPMQLFGRKLISSFVVEGSLVYFLYTLLDDKIMVEVISGPYEQATYTGEQMGVPQVGIINNQIFQTGVLQRKK